MTKDRAPYLNTAQAPRFARCPKGQGKFAKFPLWEMSDNSSDPADELKRSTLVAALASFA
jgi:hypothetical protein